MYRFIPSYLILIFSHMEFQVGLQHLCVEKGTRLMQIEMKPKCCIKMAQAAQNMKLLRPETSLLHYTWENVQFVSVVKYFCSALKIPGKVRQVFVFFKKKKSLDSTIQHNDLFKPSIMQSLYSLYKCNLTDGRDL